MNKPFEYLLAINRNENGDYYFLYSVPEVQRGIKGKNRSKVNEVLIVGVPKANLIKYLRGELNTHKDMFYVEGTDKELKIWNSLKRPQKIGE